MSVGKWLGLWGNSRVAEARGLWFELDLLTGTGQLPWPVTLVSSSFTRSSKTGPSMTRSWRIGDREYEYLKRVLDGGFPGSSEVNFVARLEAMFAESLNVTTP